MARLDGSTWVFTSELDGNPAYDAVRTRYNAYGEVSGRGVTAGPSATAAYQEVFDYDAGGRLWRSNTGDGVLRFHVYDKAGNETLTLASAGADLSAYGLSNYTSLVASNGGIQASGSVTTSNAVTALSVYDKRGQATETREPGRQFATGTTTPTLTTGVIVRGKGYNAFGEVISETDPRGYDASTGAALSTVADFRTTFEYNTMGRLTKKTSARADVTSQTGVTTSIQAVEGYGYDLSGRLVSVADANGYRTHRLLLAGTGHGDTEALIAREFHPDGGIAEMRYDVFGDARKLINEVGSVQLRDYDKLGRLTVQTHAQRPVGAIGNPDTTNAVQLIDHYAYDLNGQRIQHWNSQFGTSVKETTDYDAQGRVTRTVGFGGDTTTYKYSWSATQETLGMATGGAAFGGWTKVTHAWGAPSGKDLTETQDYFGRTVYQKDYGDHVYTFTFNLAGQLTARSNTAGESIGFTYYNSGLVAGQTGTQGIATYSYDIANNRVTETFSKDSVTWRSSVAQYDTLNRMTRWDDTGVSNGAAWIAWKYDAVGNVRNYAARYSTMGEDGVLTAPTSAASVPTESYWYLYNERDRMTLSQGDLVNGAIVRGAKATAIDYYLDGNRKSALYTATLTGQRWAYVPIGGGGGPPYEEEIPDDGGETGEWIVTTGQFTGDRREEYTYSADGFLVQTRRADAERVAVTISGEHTYTYTPPPSTANQSVADYRIDAMGRTVYYKEYGGADGSFERSGISYDNGGRVLEETAITIRRDTTGGPLNSYKTVQFNRYVDGLLVEQEQDTYKMAYNQSEYSDGDVPDSLQKYRYVWWDGALQSEIDNDKDYDNDDRANGGAGFDVNWTTRMEYDSSGRVTQAKIRDGRDRNVHYLTDQNGMIVDRDVARVTTVSWPTPGEQENANPAPRDLRYFFAGIQLGQVGNNGTDNLDYAASIKDRLVPVSNATGVFRNNASAATPYADFAQSYDAINAASMLSTAQSYTVNGGETLQSIAQAVWGDQSLWYLIADANGLTASDELVAGQILTIPNKVHNIRNSADTWRPYDPNEAVGDVSPSLAKPPKKPNCALMGMILMVAVAIAVSIVTAGAAVAALSSQVATIGQGIAAVVGAAGAANVGAATLIAAGAVGGAAGSIASQAVGIAVGVQSKINWKGVAIAGITGAIQGGLGALGRTAPSGKIIGGNFGSAVGKFFDIPFVGGAVRSIVANAATQGIARAVGLQKKFDFLGVAMAGVVGGVSQAVGGFFPQAGTYLEAVGQGLVSGMAGGIAEATARTVIDGSDFGDNLLAALPDIIGATIGNAIAGVLARQSKPRHAKDFVDGPLPGKKPIQLAALNRRDMPRLPGQDVRADVEPVLTDATPQNPPTNSKDIIRWWYGGSDEELLINGVRKTDLTLGDWLWKLYVPGGFLFPNALSDRDKAAIGGDFATDLATSGRPTT